MMNSEAMMLSNEEIDEIQNSGDATFEDLRTIKTKTSRRKTRTVASAKRRPTLRVTLGEDHFTNFWCGFKKDISEGGLFVATYNIFPVGKTVNLVVAMPNHRVLIGSATVAFVREHNDLVPEIPPGMGLVLNRLSGTAKKQINTFIEDNEPIFFEAV